MREVDVVVVGAGVAGLSVAATAAAGGRSVLVVAAGDGSTRWAQGGLAAAVGPGDAPAAHAADTLAAGADHGDPDVVAVLTEEGPQRLADLVAAGARLDRHPDGRLDLTREGGHGRARVAHAGGDATGAEVARVMRRATSGVARLEGRVTGLLTRPGAVGGALVATADGEVAVAARATVLATGGLGHAYPVTTNPAGVTGDGLALALLAGAALVDVEFVQFHPTALWTGARGQVPLVTEALRGEGAVLRDHDGRSVTAGLHPLGDLAPRDVVARAVHDACRRDGASHAWLDVRAVADLERRFPTVLAACRRHGVEPREGRVPVAPAQHYLCGGVATDAWGATGVAGLYAVGEVAGSGAHGANRLASNSLLEGLVLGRRLGSRLVLDLPPAVEATGDRRLAPDPAVADRARVLLGEAGGLVRDGAALEAAAAELAAPGADPTALVARAVLGAAAVRRESRGCHQRTDAAESRAWWRRRVVVRLDEGVPRAVAEPVRERAA